MLIADSCLLDSLKGPLNVLNRIPQNDRPAMRTAHGAIGFGQLAQQPLHFVLLQRHVHLDGCVARNAGGDAGSNLFQVQHLFLALELIQDFMQHVLDADTLIATHMNGAPLTKHHGFPARALVPGWIGAASCKWLTEIKVLDSEFAGNFMSPAYRFPNQPGKPGDAVKPEDTHPLTALSVKSVISGPLDGASLKSGRVAVHGAAWAGEADVVKVEVSTDGGKSWNQIRRANAR